ncbi:MAG: class I adenylate-forming enzyme family protein, partial [Myxococcota bacterium]
EDARIMAGEQDVPSMNLPGLVPGGKSSELSEDPSFEEVRDVFGPKGVVLTHGNLLIDAWAIARWHAFRPEDRLMCVLPIHHVNGLVVTLLTPMLFGGSTVLCRRFRTSTFWKRIQDEGVCVASVVPTLLQFLCEAGGKDLHPGALGKFRYVLCGAGPLTVDLGRRFEDTFGVPIMHGYGLSETTCYNCFLPVDLPPEAHARWMRDFGFPSIGVPIACNEMAIHDSEGRSVPAGTRGEIVVRGWDVMRYYFGRPEVNRETFAHGWFRTGDEGFYQIDDANRPFFFITGRMKELIIRGGVNISPFEIDEVLNRIPGVARGLAVGFENDWYGEEVGAYVKREADGSVDAEAVLEACSRQLPFHKRPKCVVFGEEIPVTSTGKYQRMKLRPLFAEWRDVQFRDARKS